MGKIVENGTKRVTRRKRTSILHEVSNTERMSTFEKINQKILTIGRQLIVDMFLINIRHCR